MAITSITIDGNTINDLGQWVQSQPNDVAQVLKNPHTPGVKLLARLAILGAASAAAGDTQAYTLELTTSDDGEFTLTKKHTTTG